MTAQPVPPCLDQQPARPDRRGHDRGEGNTLLARPTFHWTEWETCSRSSTIGASCWVCRSRISLASAMLASSPSASLMIFTALRIGARGSRISCADFAEFVLATVCLRECAFGANAPRNRSPVGRRRRACATRVATAGGLAENTWRAQLAPGPTGFSAG